jgi:beta-glucosidase
MTVSAQLDERTLREICLPAFETAVKKAQPWTVMCAYNKLNGVYGSENQLLLTKILKEEWGFEGLVISDWAAVHDRVVSMQAGLDLEMPGPRERRVQTVVEAVRSGRLDEAILDESVRRILRIVFKGAETARGGSSMPLPIMPWRAKSFGKSRFGAALPTDYGAAASYPGR